MNMFEYFAEEEGDIELKLTQLIENYGDWTREVVFDRVKEACDAIVAHLKKQSLMLLKEINEAGPLAGVFAEAKTDHALLEEELGQVVEVHVDEPNYVECLQKLLYAFGQHRQFSQRLYGAVKKQSTSQELDDLNADFNHMILHATDFNTLQTI